MTSRPGRSHPQSNRQPIPPLGWSIEDVSYRYPGADRHAVEGFTADIRPGSCTAVLGPNGSGKSTLLRVLLRAAAPHTGRIRLGGRPLDDWSRRDLARAIGVVPQQEELSFPITVRELVAMGRYPHLGALRPAGAHDRLAVEQAMERSDVVPFAERFVETLSGGERQRARLARALAQEPSVLALDEPTLALDIRHEMEIFELVRTLVTAGVTVLLVTHNINLAARYADALLLMDRGRLVASGPPGRVLRRGLIETVYDWPVLTTEHPGPGHDAGAVQIIPLARGAEYSRGREER
ncbi:MAG: ABC transporter ATP-binding protein [Gemmatimonadota bacterium]